MLNNNSGDGSGGKQVVTSDPSTVNLDNFIVLNETPIFTSNTGVDVEITGNFVLHAAVTVESDQDEDFEFWLENDGAEIPDSRVSFQIRQ